MAQRGYNAPEFNVRDTRQYNQSGVARGDYSANTTVQVGDDGWRDKLLSKIVQDWTPVADKYVDLRLQEEYVKGQMAAGIIESEDELEGNPLTRDWRVAGYRDTMGKLSLADAEAQFAEDLPSLRGKGPEELEAYLTARRNKLMPQLNSMSREARAALAGQLVLQDRAAIKQYTAEHAKYIIEQKSMAIHAKHNTSMRSLSAAQAQAAVGGISPEAYQDVLRSSAGSLYANVWGDPSLPESVKQKLTVEAMQMALSQGQVDLYEYFQDNKIEDGVGTTLLDRLPAEDQLKLANAYREAMNRTSDMRNIGRMEQLAKIEADIDNGTSPYTFDQLREQLAPMVVNKTISAERYQALLNKHIDKSMKAEQNTALAEMFTRGDINGILSSGHTVKDALDAVDASLAKAGATPEMRLQTYLAAGVNGMEGGFSKAGAVLGVALRQARQPDGTVLPQHLDNIRTINGALRRAEAAGNTYARVELLSGLNEADRMFAERVLRQVDENVPYDIAVANAADTEAKESSMTPSIRAATAAQTSSTVSKEIDSIESRGFLGSVWLSAKSLFSADAANEKKIRPWSSVSFRDGVFSDSPTVEFYEAQARDAVRSAASDILLLHPTATADEVLSAAKAQVAARTITTDFGPVFMPRNADLQTVFGVPPAEQSLIGPAISELFKTTKEDANFRLSFKNGALLYQEYDRNGVPIGTGGKLDPAAVRAKVKEKVLSTRTLADERYGNGRLVKQDGIEFRYSGMNKSGAPIDWMYEFRDSLIKSEGVRSSVYKDSRGVNTVGVGIAEHNPHYPKPGPDGKVSADDVRRSFAAASDDAAKSGLREARNSGVYNKAGFVLMSELAYQSGAGFMTQKNTVGDAYREFAGALQARDVESAKAAFQKTAAWRASGDSRRKHYMKLIEQSLN